MIMTSMIVTGIYKIGRWATAAIAATVLLCTFSLAHGKANDETGKKKTVKRKPVPAKIPEAVSAARKAARETRRIRRKASAKEASTKAPVAATPTPKPAAKEPIVPGEKEFNSCVKYPAHRRIKVTLKPNSELTDLVAWISSMTCKRFILADNIRSQKITLISPTDITAGEAYRAFLSALEVLGLTVAPSGRYLKIIQSNWAVQSTVPTYTDGQRHRIPATSAMVTQIIKVKNVDVGDLLLIANKLKSRNGDVTAYKPTNALMITDSGENVRRILRIIDELDIPATSEKIWIARLRFADSEEVLKVLQQVFVTKGKQPIIPPKAAKGASGHGKPDQPSTQASSAENVGLATASKMIADPITNSLIIVADATSFARIASLVKKLDIEGEGANQRIHVYHLENGDAEELANMLSSLASGGAQTHRRGKSKQQNVSATLFEGDVKVTADKATNALVIVASTKDFLSLRRVIRELDIPRRQVFVEAVILEVSLNKDRALGLSAHGGLQVDTGDEKSLLFGGLFPSTEFNSLLINPAALTGLAAGARGPLLEGSGKLLGVSADIPAFGVLLQLLQTNNNLNVLSAPHILTTDNQEAEITVGQNLPFPAGSLTSALSSASSGSSGLSSLLPAISVNRQDVALNVKLTPHVNESEMVRLELEQEVSDVVAENFNGLGPATSKRSVKTTVIVRDQQTVVIGGLMADTVRDQETKIPLLGDIPILGYLFKHTTKSVSKTNLLLVLTPHIIRDQSDLRRIFKRKLEERREFIEMYTSFTPREVTHEIDYRHKRGLLGEIHRTGMQVDQEVKLIHEAQKATNTYEPVDVPVETPSPAEPTASSSSSENINATEP